MCPNQETFSGISHSVCFHYILFGDFCDKRHANSVIRDCESVRQELF